MFGALACSIMVAICKLIGADDYIGYFAIAAVAFAIITIPFSIIIQQPKKPPVSRVELLRKRYAQERVRTEETKKAT